jgi:hypothetical protein
MSPRNHDHDQDEKDEDEEEEDDKKEEEEEDDEYYYWGNNRLDGRAPSLFVVTCPKLPLHSARTSHPSEPGVRRP